MPRWVSDIFYKVFWELIGKDMMGAIKKFHRNGSLCRSLNSTFLVLIPEKKGPNEHKDFWPISFLKSFYKILAKSLARRLEKVMSLIISPNHNAFMHGHQILDCSLVENECIDSW